MKKTADLSAVLSLVLALLVCANISDGAAGSAIYNDTGGKMFSPTPAQNMIDCPPELVVQGENRPDDALEIMLECSSIDSASGIVFARTLIGATRPFAYNLSFDVLNSNRSDILWLEAVEFLPLIPGHVYDLGVLPFGPDTRLVINQTKWGDGYDDRLRMGSINTALFILAFLEVTPSMSDDFYNDPLRFLVTASQLQSFFPIGIDELEYMNEAIEPLVTGELTIIGVMELWSKAPGLTRVIASLTRLSTQQVQNLLSLVDIAKITSSGRASAQYMLDQFRAYPNQSFSDIWYRIEDTPAAQNSDEVSIQASAIRNADWTPVPREFDGVEMVLVPAGCFEMGRDDGDSAEQPVHRVCFEEPFWIDRYEVSQGQFEAFGGQAASASYFTGENRPVEQITWYEARDFCALRGARLPTEAEWEYAARGPDALVYPWGNAFDGEKVIWARGESEGTAPVGSRPGGASWVGADDLSGNVWEWVADWYDPDYYGTLSNGVTDPAGSAAGHYRVLRGGSWNFNDSGNLQAANRGGWYPDTRIAVDGFRCARSALPTPTVVATPDPLQPAPSPVTRNTDWTPVPREFDGVEMVLVPAGCFEMGSTDGNRDEQPVHRVCFEEPFWIDRYEVSQGQFEVFGGQAASASYFTGVDRPVEMITWYEARDFCALRGARLPTEAEWEYAARGPDALVYPWGNAFDGEKVIWNSEGTAPVGSRPGGVSWVGAYDLSGNVWERVADWYDPDYYGTLSNGVIDPAGSVSGDYRVERGGSWYADYTTVLRATFRSYGWGAPDVGYYFVGFRCARSAFG